MLIYLCIIYCQNKITVLFCSVLSVTNPQIGMIMNWYLYKGGRLPRYQDTILAITCFLRIPDIALHEHVIGKTVFISD